MMAKGSLKGSRGAFPRGRMIVCGLALAGAAASGAVARAGAEETMAEPAGATGSPATIHQEVDVKANPARVYEVLLDAKQFSALSGGLPTDIQREVGGAFSCFGGHIVGRNVELVPNHRIVQAWRAVTWPEGVYSIARFELKPQGAGTRVILDHTGFPPELREHLAEGWEAHYWTMLRNVQ
jgi:activator of HSP90 ATPase